MPRQTKPEPGMDRDFHHHDAGQQGHSLLFRKATRGQPVTILDTFSIPANVSADQVRNIVQNQIGLDIERPDQVRTMGRYVSLARDFLRDELGISLPQEIDKLDASAKRGVLRLFEIASRNTKELRHGFGPYACALLKVCRALGEVHRKNYTEFHRETALLDAEIKHILDIQSTSRTTPSGYEVLGLRTLKRDVIDVQWQTRAKTLASTLVKMLTYPETDAQSVVTDGMGVMITVPDPRDFSDTVMTIAKAMRTGLAGGDTMSLKNNGGMEPNKLLSMLHRNGIDVDVTTKPNPKSSGAQFISLKITHPRKGNISREVPIEIQIHPLAPHQWQFHHDVYDAKKKISLWTRLFGFMPRAKFNDLIQETFDKIRKSYPKVTTKNIREEFLAYVTSHSPSGGGEIRYSAANQIHRILETEPDLLPRAARAG